MCYQKYVAKTKAWYMHHNKIGKKKALILNLLNSKGQNYTEHNVGVAGKLKESFVES